MTFDKDYIAVITGACGGIGESVAHALAKEGVSLALLDNNASQLATLVATLQNNHPQPIAGFNVDVADDRSVAEAFTAIGRQLGPVGYLVNGAGVLCHASVAETQPQDWTKTFAVNATGVFNTSRHAANLMMAQRKGSIVTIASNAARVPRATMAAYCASKAAARHLPMLWGWRSLRTGSVVMLSLPAQPIRRCCAACGIAKVTGKTRLTVIHNNFASVSHSTKSPRRKKLLPRSAFTCAKNQGKPRFQRYWSTVAPHSAAAKRTRRITWKRYSPIRCRQNVNYPNQWQTGDPTVQERRYSYMICSVIFSIFTLLTPRR